jgi:hypothetical protein
MPHPDPTGATLPTSDGTRLWLWVFVAALAGAVLGLIFLAYLQPAFLMEVLNLRYCG